MKIGYKTSIANQFGMFLVEIPGFTAKKQKNLFLILKVLRAYIYAIYSLKTRSSSEMVPQHSKDVKCRKATMHKQRAPLKRLINFERAYFDV